MHIAQTFIWLLSLYFEIGCLYHRVLILQGPQCQEIWDMFLEYLQVLSSQSLQEYPKNPFCFFFLVLRFTLLPFSSPIPLLLPIPSPFFLLSSSAVKDGHMRTSLRLLHSSLFRSNFLLIDLEWKHFVGLTYAASGATLGVGYFMTKSKLPGDQLVRYPLQLLPKPAGHVEPVRVLINDGQ